MSVGRSVAAFVLTAALVAFGLWGLSRPRGEAPPETVREIRALRVPTDDPGAHTPNVLDERRRDPETVYDPDAAGEPMPPGYRRLLGRDAIRPIYEPEIVRGAEVDWPDDALVIGVALDGPDGSAARAYPVRTLDAREMVVDRLAGIPILVTW